jgi:hypothetical protein
VGFFAVRMEFWAVLYRLGLIFIEAFRWGELTTAKSLGEWGKILGVLPAALGVFAFGVGLFLFCCWAVCAAGSAVCLRRWPLLVFMSVYLYCPCAGRHLLFFAAAKKSRQKKAGSHRQLLGVHHARIFEVVRARSGLSHHSRQ